MNVQGHRRTAQLSVTTSCTFLPGTSPSYLRAKTAEIENLLRDDLQGPLRTCPTGQAPDDRLMATTRTRRTYGPRFRHLIRETGDVRLAIHSTASRRSRGSSRSTSRSTTPAFRGQTPDEVYFGTGGRVPDELHSQRMAARAARLEANRAVFCETCQSTKEAS